MRAIELFLIALATLSTAIAAPQAAKPNQKPAAATAVRQQPKLGDAQIEAAIRAKLAKSKIGKDGFRFKVAKGVVTWDGTTDVVQHKGSATRMAKTAGAAQVVNNIQVSARGKDKAMATLKKAHVE